MPKKENRLKERKSRSASENKNIDRSNFVDIVLTIQPLRYKKSRPTGRLFCLLIVNLGAPQLAVGYASY